jgi:hypothetical protein
LTIYIIFGIILSSRRKKHSEEEIAMAKKFDLFKALRENGFVFVDNTCLTKEYSKTVETVWNGKQEIKIFVEVFFDEEHETCKAYFYQDVICMNGLFKSKTYKANKRTFNAIKETIEWKGFEF